jgi:hypothetical protein
MTVLYIILGLISIFIIGFIKVLKANNKAIDTHNFIFDYREKFIDFANKYFESHNKFLGRDGSFDGESYTWLTKNVNKVQDTLGHSGTIEYIASYQRYRISNYQIVINTIPKFRDGTVEIFDINSTDDCLLRYLGQLDGIIEISKKNLKNPVIWFKIGVQEILSIPFFILNWFGIFSNRTINKIIGGTFYKIITGVIALVTLVSGSVTIIVGKEQTIEYINNLLGK